MLPSAQVGSPQPRETLSPGHTTLTFSFHGRAGSDADIHMWTGTRQPGGRRAHEGGPSLEKGQQQLLVPTQQGLQAGQEGASKGISTFL